MSELPGIHIPQRWPYTTSRDASDVSAVLGSEERCFLYHGDCRDLLRALPDACVQLVITSPPYNIGKAYEDPLTLEQYVAFQTEVITECVRVTAPTGSVCWEVGNHIAGPQEILPLDILLHPIFARLGLRLRNRIVWHFEHGLHCQRRFSGRYEVIMWYTKSDEYQFNLDAVRVPQKYPGKRHFKGPRAGELSGNPLGKNPSDVWIFPNVKSNHREKTVHPCQFPVELVDRLLLAMTQPHDLVLDPFAGVSSALCAAILRERRACGAEIVEEYVRVSAERIEQAFAGTLPVRPADQPVHEPRNDRVSQLPIHFREARRAVGADR
ncbi:MAG: site-specific DNA-methyltransferase [Armatimonadetes bacterium]|nr:site-specific DNA-methyltransferase [Armatimonadota bacterium]